ncbi:MAG: gamma-glutamylcyclotransferase [Planctomycetota bacterium]
MAGRSLYFAYGSNLDPVQTKRRCPGSDAVGMAFANGYSLSFPIHSDGDWKGGVASIEPHHAVPAEEPRAAIGGGVWGVLYLVTDKDLKTLDGYEGVPEGMYRRGEVQLKVPPQKKSETAITYFAMRGFNAPQKPSRKYLNAIVRGAEHHGLPEAYLASLRSVPTNDVGG